MRFVYMARPAKWLKSLKVQVVEGVPLTTRMFGRTYGLLGRFARGLVMFLFVCACCARIYCAQCGTHTSGSGRSVPTTPTLGLFSTTVGAAKPEVAKKDMEITTSHRSGDKKA